MKAVVPEGLTVWGNSGAWVFPGLPQCPAWGRPSVGISRRLCMVIRPTGGVSGLLERESGGQPSVPLPSCP